MKQQLSGREARFRSLYQAHRDAVRVYCSRRLGPDSADDAAAEVFVVAWRRLDEVPGDDEAALWLYGIARNVVRNTRRSMRRRHRLGSRLASLAEAPDPGPEVQVVRRAEDQRLLDAVARLRPLEQELLRLRTWEELPAAEIATVTGLSVRAVETRLSRIRKKLERRLQPPSAAPHTASRRVQHGGGRR